MLAAANPHTHTHLALFLAACTMNFLSSSVSLSARSFFLLFYKSVLHDFASEHEPVWYYYTWLYRRAPGQPRKISRASSLLVYIYASLAHTLFHMNSAREPERTRERKVTSSWGAAGLTGSSLPERRVTKNYTHRIKSLKKAHCNNWTETFRGD